MAKTLYTVEPSKSRFEPAFQVAAQRDDSVVQILDGLVELSTSPSVFFVDLVG